MHWLSNLPPGEQISLLIQAGSAVFGAGAFWATVLFLTKRVAKAEDRLDAHDAKFQEHGEDIAALKERTAHAGGHGGRGF